jgi:hypothetical protein
MFFELYYEYYMDVGFYEHFQNYLGKYYQKDAQKLGEMNPPHQVFLPHLYHFDFQVG